MDVSFVLKWLLTQWSVFLVVLSLIMLYRWSTANYNYFTDRGISHLKPVPLFGNFLGVLMKKENIFRLTDRLYKQFAGERFYGIFAFRRPVLIISDPEVVKRIAVKDFEHFLDHRVIFEEQNDSLFAKSLVSLKGQRWKNMRATLSPVFTGSKMREMFELVVECAEKTVAFLVRPSSDRNLLEMDTKDLTSRFTTDVIASTAFGLQVDSLEDRDNEFYTMGKTVTSFNFSATLKILMNSVIPAVAKLFKFSLFPKHISERFRQIVIITIEHRKRNNVVRRDVLQLLMEATTGSLPSSDAQKFDQGGATDKDCRTVQSSYTNNYDYDDLIAQCFLFFFAGFETSSILLCFCMQELIENPDVQEKLYEEIRSVEVELNGDSLSYDVLQKMKYFDMVISETLRKWPPAPVTDRICTKSYDMENNGRKFRVEKGNLIMIPIMGFHRDFKYFSDPDKFDPERFSEQNKHKIKPFSYLPFGAGPRGCIASRFALMECKALLFHLLARFSIEASAKTQIPIEMDETVFGVRTKNGFWVKFTPRM